MTSVSPNGQVDEQTWYVHTVAVIQPRRSGRAFYTQQRG